MSYIIVDQDTVVDELTVYNFVYSDAYDGDRPINMAWNDDGIHNSPDFINKGTLSFVGNTIYPFMMIWVATSSSWKQSQIINNGTINVSANGFAWGIRGNSWTPSFENTGSFTITSNQQAIGVESWGYFGNVDDQVKPEPLINNSGTITINGDSSAFAFYLGNGGDIINTGTITVTANSGKSVGISEPATNSGTINNSGTITVSNLSADGLSTGIIFYAISSYEKPLHIINSGAITATRVIVEQSSYPLDDFDTGQVVINSGILNGDSFLGYGKDEFTNSGTINGNVDLGDHDDFFDGTGGIVKGIVYAGSGNDIIIAGNGKQDFRGEDGNDLFQLGHGNIYFDAGAGLDTLDLLKSNFGVTLNIDQNIQTLSDNTSITLINFENINGSNHNDSLTGNEKDNQLSAGLGNDVINGVAGNDLIIGQKGNDILIGGTGHDTFIMTSGDGNDTINDFDHLSDIIDVNDDDGHTSYSIVQSGNNSVITFENGEKITLLNVISNNINSSNLLLLDISKRDLSGSSSDDNLIGGINDDILRGLGGNDQLIGGRGDDWFDGGDGNDIIDGGTGNDTVSYESEQQLVIASLSQGWAQAWRLSGGASDSLISIENIIGSNYGSANSNADSLFGSESSNWIWARAGNDKVEGLEGDDHLFGEIGDDSISGGAGNDSLFGGEDNDTLDGGLGADLLDGGTGFDVASYIDATSGLTAFLGVSSLNSGSAAGDSFANIEGIIGSSFGDILWGTRYANSIDGSFGNDWLYGQDGADTILGGDGSDVISGGLGADSLDGGAGKDVAFYRDATASVYSVATNGVKADMVDGHTYGISLDVTNVANGFGEATGDTLTNIENIWGSNFDDIIRGSDSVGGQVYGFWGNDLLDGRGGNDVFYGGVGSDTIITGAGADDIYYKSYHDQRNAFGTLEPFEGGDTITDFEHGVDHVTVSRYWFGFGNIVGVAQSLTSQYADFITSGTTPISTKPTFFYDQATGQLMFDPDGTGKGAAVLMVTFSNHVNLTLSDIWTA